MAGDWIKMRSNLWDDPRVSRLCDLTDQPEAMVIGALYWLWATADQHTEDGILHGMTLRAIDRKTGLPGFGEALLAIGWVADHPEGVRIVNFDEHNGASAKRRGLEARRKAGARNVSASDADKKRTPCGAREREEDIKPSHTPCAGEADAVADDAGAAAAATPDPDQPDFPDAPVPMTLDWSPDERLLAAYARRAGVPVSRFTPEALAPFVLYHEPKGVAQAERAWVAALVRWVQRDNAQAARVVPLRAAKGGGFADFDDNATGWLGE